MVEEQKTLTPDEKKKIDKENAIICAFAVALLIFFWIIANFLVGLILALVGGVVVYKILKSKPELRKFMPVGLVVMVVLIAVAIFAPAMKSDKEWKSERDEILSGTSQTYNYLTEAGTPARDVELGALRALGHETKIRKIDFSEDELWIDYIANENLTKNLTRGGIWIDTKDLVKELSLILSPDVKAITVEPYLTLVDQYGEEKLSRVALITIERETWEKINWDNFLTDDIPNIADSFWLHPALSD